MGEVQLSFLSFPGKNKYFMSNEHEMKTQPYIPRFRQPEKPIREMETQMWQRPLPEPEPPAPKRRSHRWVRLMITVVILLFLMVSVALVMVGGLILYQVD